MVTVAKMEDGKVVAITRIAETVPFSEDRGWICICFDFEQEPRRWGSFKWIPASTRFTWVREYV